MPFIREVVHMRRVKHPVKKLLLLALAAGVLLLWLWRELPCVIRSLTGIPCPGCGMTRAWLACFRLRLGEAFSYHPMFWSIPVLAAYWFFDGKLLGKARLDRIILGVILVGMAVCYGLRLAAFYTGRSYI